PHSLFPIPCCGVAVFCVLLLWATAASAQTQTAAPTPTPDTPVGHWVAEHVTSTGIGSWWDFRPDGTLTMQLGAIVTLRTTRSGDTFTSPPVTPNGLPIKVTFHIDGDTLHLQSLDTPDQVLTRIGSAPS